MAKSVGCLVIILVWVVCATVPAWGYILIFALSGIGNFFNTYGKTILEATGGIIALVVVVAFVQIFSKTKSVVSDAEIVEVDEKVREEIKRTAQEKKREVQENRKKAQEMRRLLERRKIAKLERIFTAHSGIIDKFFEISYRKVSVIDEYGDEDWSVLNDEILKCIFKIVQQSQKELRWELFNDNPGLYFNNRIRPDIDEFIKVLKERFKSYYKTKKRGKGKDIDIKGLSGVEFETFVSNVLKKNGYTDVSGTPATGDQVADILAKKDGKTIVIQAKRWEGAVGNKAVQEVIGALKFYGGDEGWVVTNSVFTSSAKALAQKANIRLVDGNDLKEWVNTSVKKSKAV